ncbi:MAG: hypothetical protein OHK0039_15680 [Bacteroidia bacterium]
MVNVNRNYLILGGLALLTILAFLLINHFSGSGNPTQTPTYQNLSEEIFELESSLLELEAVVQDKEMQTGDLTQLLQEKYDQITFMEQRIEELEREGKLDKATIDDLRRRLNNFKETTQLYERYKLEINELVIENNRLVRIVDTVVPNLEQALVDCQDGKVIDPALLNNTPRTEEPTETVAILKAENFAFKAKANGKQVDFSSATSTPRVKSKDLKTLDVCFDLAGNSLVKSFEELVYLRIEDPDGEAYKHDKGKSNLILINGIQGLYTTSAIANYQQGRTLKQCIEVTLENQADFKPGFQTVKVIYGGKIIGQTKFLVQ